MDILALPLVQYLVVPLVNFNAGKQNLLRGQSLIFVQSFPPLLLAHAFGLALRRVVKAPLFCNQL
jgi:hypothetical protein